WHALRAANRLRPRHRLDRDRPATQDTAEHAIAELRLDKLRLRAPVFHGDTLTAYTEVIGKRDADRDDAGIVRFKHWGVKQDGTIVFEGEREVLLKRRSHWVRGE